MATCGLATPQVSGKRGSHGHLAEVGAMWDCPVGPEATGWTAVGKRVRDREEERWRKKENMNPAIHLLATYPVT